MLYRNCASWRSSYSQGTLQVRTVNRFEPIRGWPALPAPPSGSGVPHPPRSNMHRQRTVLTNTELSVSLYYIFGTKGIGAGRTAEVNAVECVMFFFVGEKGR